jgi:glutamate-1-semialdehyde 2,1-aminomutase
VAAAGVDRALVRKLLDDEEDRFRAQRPRSAALLERARSSMPNGVPMAWFASAYAHPPPFVAGAEGARFTDVDGHTYADFNIADMSMFGGYGPEPVVQAVAERIGAGSQFLLPTEDAVWVAEELARRFGLPKWQFTLSASNANVEAIRVARVATGRDVVLMFDGKYHGHFDQGLVELEDGVLVPGEPGLPRRVAEDVRIVAFNDATALHRALEPRDVAVVVAEPAMTNNHGLILPESGFHDAVRKATRESGTLLCLDETHTQVCGPGGLTRVWGLEPDLITTGKSVGGGVPFGAFGMAEELASLLEIDDASRGTHRQPVATGGTLFANALSTAAARATLAGVLTEEAYARTARLGARLADGLEGAIGRAGLGWVVHRLFARSGVAFGPGAPRNAQQAARLEDPLLTSLCRVWLANRGVWDAIPGAGPTVAVPATDEDVDRYVDAYGDLVEELSRSGP